MKICITGASGLIGQRLQDECHRRGWAVIGIKRNELYSGGDLLQNKLVGADAVIHLAGAPIIKRWTKKYKKEMADSRILTTENLVKAINTLPDPPGVFISTSAVGIYREQGIHTEARAVFDDGFLGRLCMRWENAAEPLAGLSRLVIFRLGIVLAANGGALKKMALPFRLGVGGPIGNGLQMTSWIHIDDLVAAYIFALENEISGVFNLVSPQPVSNRELSKSIGAALNRPSWLKVPAAALSLLYGEGASVLTSGQAVVPENLMKAGFEYRFPEINKALEDLLKTKK